jgi:DNA invertase Pin-like site-specific DNA recombinase
VRLAAFKQAGCKRLLTDKVSGAYVKQPHLTRGLASLQAGEVLVVWIVTLLV